AGDDQIAPGVAVQRVVSLAATDPVVPRSSVNGVVAVAAGGTVTTPAEVDGVVAAEGPDAVVARKGLDRVVGWRAGQPVAARRADDGCRHRDRRDDYRDRPGGRQGEENRVATLPQGASSFVGGCPSKRSRTRELRPDPGRACGSRRGSARGGARCPRPRASWR